MPFGRDVTRTVGNRSRSARADSSSVPSTTKISASIPSQDAMTASTHAGTVAVASRLPTITVSSQDSRAGFIAGQVALEEGVDLRLSARLHPGIREQEKAPYVASQQSLSFQTVTVMKRMAREAQDRLKCAFVATCRCRLAARYCLRQGYTGQRAPGTRHSGRRAEVPDVAIANRRSPAVPSVRLTSYPAVEYIARTRWFDHASGHGFPAKLQCGRSTLSRRRSCVSPWRSDPRAGGPARRCVRAYQSSISHNAASTRHAWSFELRETRSGSCIVSTTCRWVERS